MPEDPTTASDDVVAAAALLARSLSVVRRLPGGEHALTQLVTDGPSQYVLRSFPAGDPAAARELTVLPRLAGLGESVPSLVAHDLGRTRPLLVTGFVAGTPPPPQASATTLAVPLARMLARIHGLDGDGLPTAPEPPAPAPGPIAALALAQWPRLDLDRRVLSHGDYWSGNTLWTSIGLTGVVDWSGSRSAPRGFDLAWCRQDLVLLGDPGAADVLLAEYRRCSGVPLADVALWDVHAAAYADPLVESWAPNYAGIGRRHLTATRLRRRLDDWIDRLLAAQPG